MSSSSSNTPPIWLYSYLRLRFFNRIRRFLRSKASTKRNASPSDLFDPSKPKFMCNEIVQVIENESTSSCSEDDCAAALQRAVKRLHFGSWEEKAVAAEEIGSLAKEDLKVRKLMVELGVIPALVSMVVSETVTLRRVAAKALIELANGSYTNNAMIMDAGILSKLPKNIHLMDEQTKHEFTKLLLSLSSLSNTQFHILSLDLAITFLLQTLESTSNNDTKSCCLGAFYNFSTVLENAGALVSNGVVHTLLKLSSVKDLSEKALATLGNLVVTLMGKKDMENSPVVPSSLIEILTWEEKPKCQELSAYILMMLAHQSSAQREKMAKLGIVAVLLEVALLGSPIAQKRALKLLEWFKDERQVKVGAHSGPQTGRFIVGSPLNRREAQEGKRMMKDLVKQSLHKNMELITRRAGVGESDKVKSFVISTSSKSLPY